jgi:hypothetical protein
LVARLREANAEIQLGSYFSCFDHPYVIDRVVFHSVLVVFIITLFMTQEYSQPEQFNSRVRKAKE